MRFHEVHGVNASLDDDRKVALRTGSFCDAFVFSEVPLRLNSYTAIKLTSSDQEWQGRCFLGVTSKNPISFIESAFSKHILTLLNTEDVWFRSVSESWASASLIVHLTFDGQLEITSEFEPNVRYIFFENLPINFPLWLVIDLYGACNGVQLPTFDSPNSKEIISLGSDAATTFKCGEEGIVPYNFARIVLIGPKSSGKSMLKNILSNNMNMEVKDLDLSETSNHYLSADNGEWFLLSNLTANRTSLEERPRPEIYHELAQNIVHEIVITNKEQQLDTSSSSSKDLIKNVLKFPRKTRKSFSKEVKQLSENVNEIPEELMVIIEDLLKNISNEDNAAKVPSKVVVSQKHIVNLCDFSGNLLYLIVNQFFFTSCAIYLFVFNLSDDLESPMSASEYFPNISELHNQSASLLNLIHLWITLIHTTIASFPIPSEAGEGEQSTDEENTFEVQPQVLLVGTHRNSIHAEPITRNQIVKEIFEKIFASFADKSYASHLYKNYIALDCKEMSFDEPSLLQSLKKLAEKMIVEEKTTGFNIPLPWLQLGQILEKLKQRAIYFVDINQLHEVVSSQVDAFQSYENLNAALHFYHNQAKVFYLDCVGQTTSSERNNTYELGIIILDPNWFVNCVYLLCAYLSNMNGDDDNYQFGVISETIINKAWSDCIDQKFILLGCLENLDIICELSPYIQLEDAPDVAATSIMPKLYFFPWISKPMMEHDSQLPNENFGDSTFQFVIAFNLLPLSLFTRLLIRLSKWSWNQGWGRKPEMYNSKGRIAVDFDHDIILKINLMQSRVYVVILKIFEELQNDQIENLFIGPAANVCVKVHHLIESELESLKNTYYRRLSYKLVIPCPCDATCSRHKVEGCIDEKCLHFLSLQECLKKKVVECAHHRQVRTTFIQRYLPYAPAVNSRHRGLAGCLTDTSSAPLPSTADELMYDSMYSQNPNDVWDNIFQVEPLWMREAAKLLNANQMTNDWIALAKRLSYSERDVAKFGEEISPSLSLLKDWYESNGRTRYCIDVLVSCLRMLSRDDIASLIEYELEPESTSPPIFLSYQRDSQKQVLEIRRKLELSGFPCWMDSRYSTNLAMLGGRQVGPNLSTGNTSNWPGSSLSAGDSLYGKIYEGISRAKVFICCLTPRYVASPMCNREVTLADVLHKPILPLIIEFTPWPPPGAMALIMSSIVYIDLCGVGSHSGIGKMQDTETRFREILDRVSRYISGYSDMPVVSSRYLQLPDLFNSRRTEPGGQSSNGPMNAGALVRQASEARSISPPVDIQQEHRIGERSRPEENVRETELPFTSDDIISGDNISVISRARIANRITNCSVCSLM